MAKDAKPERSDDLMVIRNIDGSIFYEGPRIPIEEALRMNAIEGHLVMGVDLSGQDLRRADLGGLGFKDVDFSGATLSGSRAMNVTFDACDFSGVKAKGMQASNARFINSDFTPLHGHNPNFAGADLDNAFFCGSILDRVHFDHANMTLARFASVSAKGVSFEHCDLSGSEHYLTRYSGCSFCEANLAATASDGSGIEAPETTSGTVSSGNDYRDAQVPDGSAFALDRGMEKSFSHARKLAELGAGVAMTMVLKSAAAKMAISIPQLAWLLSLPCATWFVTKAREWLSKKLTKLARDTAGQGVMGLRKVVQPLVMHAARRIGNVQDLFVVLASGNCRKALTKAFRIGPHGSRGPVSAIIHALAGDAHIVVCDARGLRRALTWLEHSFLAGERLASDVVLLRDEIQERGPTAIRFHAGGGMAAVFVDADGHARVRRRCADEVRSRLELAMLERYRKRSPEAIESIRDAVETRHEFILTYVRQVLGEVPPGFDPDCLGGFLRELDRRAVDAPPSVEDRGSRTKRGGPLPTPVAVGTFPH